MDEIGHVAITTPPGGIACSEIVQRVMMSEYLQKLDRIARERYLEKLKLLGLDEKGDPYDSRNRTKFVDKMKLWPAIEYGHIFCYYIERPGVYTRQQLMQWKSLEAFNYFQSGHVREIQVWKPSPDICIVIARVNPSQHAPDKAHHAWIGTKMNGEIIALHCTYTWLGKIA